VSILGNPRLVLRHGLRTRALPSKCRPASYPRNGNGFSSFRMKPASNNDYFVQECRQLNRYKLYYVTYFFRDLHVYCLIYYYVIYLLYFIMSSEMFYIYKRFSQTSLFILHELNDRGIGVRFPTGTNVFSLLHSVETDTGAYPVGT
jgi:hypothetical protein